MQSNLYYDIDSSISSYFELIKRMEIYANKNNIDIFLFKVPKSDLKDSSYEHNGCFMILSGGYKIALVNAFASKQEFEDYCEDVEEVINYLCSKYEYRSELGRFSKWGKPLIVSNVSYDNLENLENFWESLKVTNPCEKKYTELLVTLCSGSVNDIERVKADVPISLLDQVKQKIQAFDADQTRFIYGEYDTQKLIKIQGLSGTGKTELLLHKLKELYQKKENYRIFVTCHNKILADSLKDRIPKFFNFMKVTQQIEWNDRLWCTHAWGSLSNPYSGLYRYLCFYYDIPYYQYKPNNSFDSVCKTAITDIRHKYPNGDVPSAFDFLIVDECQDFKDSFFDLCQMVTAKKVYIAGDIFQSIFAEHSGKDYKADYFLKKCYRTDPKTLMFAHALGLGLFEDKRLRWLSKDDWEACGYQYEENLPQRTITLTRNPVRRFLDIDESFESISAVGFDKDNIYEQVVSQIEKLIIEFPTCSVNDFCVIFLDSNQEVYTMALKLENIVFNRLGWRVNKAYENKKKIEGTLLVSNRNNVKGLEYPFVICITTKIIFDYVYRNAIYTMLTRSFLKTILFLPVSNSGINKDISKGYNEIMNSKKMTIKIPTDDEIKQIETRFWAAKNRKPFIEIVKNHIATLNLSESDAEKLLKVSMTYQWEGLLDEEICSKVDRLKEFL